MIEYFLKPKPLVGNMKVELDLSNYTTKSDLKNTTGLESSKFSKKVDLASIKSKIGFGVLVKNEVVKNTEYNELVKILMLVRILILGIQ